MSLPPGALANQANFTVTASNTAPAEVSPPGGGTFLRRTVEVIPDRPVRLQRTVEIQIDLAPTDLGGQSLSMVQGGLLLAGRLEPRPTRIVDPDNLVLSVQTDHLSTFVLFTAARPGPALSGPAPGATLPGLGTSLTWSNPPGAVQYHLQVVPFNGDGPGIDLIRNIEASYTLAPPELGGAAPNYIMLPDMTYAWRVRTTDQAKSSEELTESDWSAWSVGAFHTAPRSSATIAPSSPPDGAAVTGATPTLTWTNAAKDVFYYEVQLSKDPLFGPEAFLYWELRHGGATTPPNSYTVPGRYPLEQGTRYYWRVRPRVQGDGLPTAWSTSASFTVG